MGWNRHKKIKNAKQGERTKDRMRERKGRRTKEARGWGRSPPNTISLKFYATNHALEQPISLLSLSLRSRPHPALGNTKGRKNTNACRIIIRGQQRKGTLSPQVKGEIKTRGVGRGVGRAKKKRAFHAIETHCTVFPYIRSSEYCNIRRSSGYPCPPVNPSAVLSQHHPDPTFRSR